LVPLFYLTFSSIRERMKFHITERQTGLDSLTWNTARSPHCVLVKKHLRNVENYLSKITKKRNIKNVLHIGTVYFAV